MVPAFDKQLPHLVCLLIFLGQLLRTTWELLPEYHAVDRHLIVVLGIWNLPSNYLL